ncbi:PTS glucose transporter subunit IIA [Lacticaseibacillus yichunensis]|uniref:PTS glucose transporter subunit IIA n=1 Tax=Lacticaseibacillus yichunensis TaxID=2486015 RepID=A0ABW4CPF2_9LACO|nr:PTS glucose transporter subunit IIA [Lacticaseibacillus yichunensis]
MGKYDADAADLLKELGGPSNLVSQTHFATRMSFTIKDDLQASRPGINAIPSVQSLFSAGKQFQVVIGEDVAEFAAAFETALSQPEKPSGGFGGFLQKLGFGHHQAAPEPAAPVTPVVETSNTARSFDYLYLPADGPVTPLAELAADPFKALAGFAVRPASNKVFSPVVGTVTSIANKREALTLKMTTGVDVLVHMGLDTAALGGRPFNVVVQIGDAVDPDTLLATMDLVSVRGSARATEIVVAVTEADQVKAFEPLLTSGTHRHGDAGASVDAK